LQTFPDDFEFIGSKESVRKQIGMAVPVDGVRFIFEAVLNTFAGIDYPADDYSIDPLLQPEHIDIYNYFADPEQPYILEREPEYMGI
jgi:DNA (cytosine-5)-methyltransferase 1